LGLETWVEASIVVDVANVAFRIGRERFGRERWVDPDLAQVRSVLANAGIAATEFQVALPLEAVAELGVAPDGPNRMAVIDRSRRWLREQQAVLGESVVRPLRGGTDGRREIGVDAMCALAAIATAEREGVEAVVILSCDTDLIAVQEHVDRLPVYVAGCFDGRARSLLRKQRRAWIDLRPESFAAMATPSRRHPAPPLPRFGPRTTDGGGWTLTRVSPDTPSPVDASSTLGTQDHAERTRRRRRAAEGAGVIAVTDPYGTSLAAARAIGVSKLPTPTTVEQLLLELGWDHPVTQFAVVPDIVDHLLASADMTELRRQALQERDAELEALIRAYRGDGDVRTFVATGRLAAERPDAIDAELRRIEEKQVVTTLAADTLWALLHTDAPVVVITDRAELTYLLEQLDGFVPDAADRLTRIGLHARPFEPEQVGLPDAVVGPSELAGLAALRAALPPTHETTNVVVLNGPTTARLVNVDRQLHGPDLLASVHRAVSDESVEWRMARFDAESLGAVLSPVDRPEIEIVFHRMLELDCEVARRLSADDVLPAGALEVQLTFDPRRPCAMPVLERSPTAGHSTDIAVVLEHREGSILVDADGDGRANTTLSVGHGGHAYRVGDPVLFRRRAIEAGSTDELIGPLRGPAGRRPVGAPIVVEATGDGHARDPDAGAIGDLHEVPDLRDHRREAGSRFLAYPCEDGSYQALSTELPHLRR
jgi:hypothetical protein